MSLVYPPSISVPFARDAVAPYIRVVPVSSQIGIQNGAASWATGFVPLNMTLKTAGGTAPFGSDMNGVMNVLSANILWVAAGGAFVFNSNIVTNASGYSFGAIVVSAVFPDLFFWSTKNNNTTDPDVTPGTDWIAFHPLSNTTSLVQHVAVAPETIDDAPILGSTGLYEIDTTAGAVDITGLQARQDGQTVTICNVGTGGNLLTLKANDSGSNNANRFRVVTDLSITDGDSITVRWFLSASNGKWLKI